MKFRLVETPSWSEYDIDLTTHYAGSKTAMMRSIFFGIFDDSPSADKKYPNHLQHCKPPCLPRPCDKCGKIGVVGAQSISMPMKEVKARLYGENFDIRRWNMEVVSNDIMRMYVHEPNLASQVLAIWVKLLREAWQRKYNVKLRAIVSLSYGGNEKGGERQGLCFQAANWEYCGKSKGDKRHLVQTEYKKALTPIFSEGKVKLVDQGKTWFEKGVPKHIWLWDYERRPRFQSRGEASVVQGVRLATSGEMGAQTTPDAPLTKYRMEVRDGKYVMVPWKP